MAEYEQSINYQLIDVGKSWIFVNPNHGCPLGCGYCVEQKDDWFERKISSVYSVDETLDQLYASPIIIKDRSPLTFFNYSDPFLAQNTEKLMPILEELDGQGWHNKIGLISKVVPSGDVLDRLANMEHLDIHILASYANLLPGLERVSPEQRIQLHKESAKRGLKTITYSRPIVEEWVSDERTRELAEQVHEYTDAFVLSGIRLTPEIVTQLQKRSLPVPAVKNYTNKHKDKALMTRLAGIIAEVSDKPVFEHTSCAISYLSEEPDYNSHNIRQEEQLPQCTYLCTPSQQGLCGGNKEQETSDEELEELIEKTGKDLSFRREGQTIVLTGSQVQREDVSFIRHIIPEFVRLDK